MCRRVIAARSRGTLCRYERKMEGEIRDGLIEEALSLVIPKGNGDSRRGTRGKQSRFFHHARVNEVALRT
jgi:hypothetical protein